MPMYTDVLGRVRNIDLRPSKPLLPLFEAVANSFDAIESVGETQGRIEIVVNRDSASLLSKEDRTAPDITGFEIRDNGVGFTDENLNSFQTSDTTFKAKRGGKGVGRFLWLVAFDTVQIESHYADADQMKCRQFSFVPKGDGVESLDSSLSEKKDRLTTVRLIGFKDRYAKTCPKKPETLAAYIVEHFLSYFFRENCPSINLRDNGSNDIFNLNDVFVQEMAANSKLDPYKIKSQDFLMRHVKLYSSHANDHYIHFCAYDRVVKSEKITGKLPGLVKRLQDDDGRLFVYASYVESAVLDACVTSERTDFNIAEDLHELLPDEIAWSEIKKVSVDQSSAFLRAFTEPVTKKIKERIDTFIETEAPMYRPILTHIAEKIAVYDPEIKNDDLDLKMYEAYQSLQLKAKSDGKSLMKDIESDTDFEDYENKLKEYFDLVTDLNSSDLARYVCQRRAVLDFLYKQLTIKDSGKYRTEDRIHDIIFPRGSTSAEVEFDKHNLWLIDEKLAYHKFLASDKQLRTLKPLKSHSQKEPDIIVFDKACAFSPSKEMTFPTITIIEFKRPMRDDYTKGYNPFNQVVEYIEAIKAGKARTTDGRNVPFQQGIHFFCYIVCDMAPSLEKQAKFFGLDKTADGQGFFGYQKNYDAYFEVISYSKMVADAKMRNAVLFDKLNLPTSIS
jgi:hypothetical protein